MLHRNINAKYYDAVSPEGDAGGGEGAVAETPPEKTYTQAELDELTGGMKSKLDELLGEKKAAAAKAKEAEAARILAEQEAARKTSDLDKFEASLRGEFVKEKEELTGELEALKGGIKAERKQAVLSSFSNDFHAEGAVDLIGQLVQTDFDGGQIKTQFTDFTGNVITTDAAEFRKWMAKHSAISHLMKADGATGGGASGSKNNAGGVNATQLKRDEFEALAPAQQMQFVKSGGKIE
jgi:hypothetical protein